MKKLLSILGSVGMIGTAGATVVACGDKGESKNPAEALKAEITKAEGLVKDSKKDKSVTDALQAAIEKAQKVSANEKATEQELKDAKTELTEAIKKFNDAEDAKTDPIETAKKALEAKIGEADELVKKAEKEAAAVAKLKTASDEAKAVLKEAKDEKTLNDATGKLASAIDEYSKAKNK